jgi:hypothetical protein
MRTLIMVIGAEERQLCLMTQEQIDRCKVLLKDYEDTQDWPDEANDIIDATLVKPGTVIEQCVLSKDLIDTESECGGYIEGAG